MAALTAATTRRESAGSMTLMMFTFTSVATGDTFASGIGGGNIIHSWATMTGAQVTQASAGVNVTRSADVYTFKPGEDSLSMTLFVFATI